MSHDALLKAKVTGSQLYTADIALPGMLVAGIVSSPHPHAEIVSIDVSGARDRPGVVCALTFEDLLDIDPWFGVVFRDQPILAAGKTRFAGEPVAAVAATDSDVLDEALSRIEVEYRTMDFATDCSSALEEGAPLVHSCRARRVGSSELTQLAEPLDGNVCTEMLYESGGSIDEALGRSDHVIENTFYTAPVHHFAMEPHCVIAQWRGGELEVWSTTQTPYDVRNQLASIFGVDADGVRVRVPPLGGAFGGKTYTRFEPLAAALARAAGSPVKLVLNSRDVFSSLCRGESIVRVRTGAMQDGTIVAWDADFLWNCGAYSGNAPRVGRADYHCVAPYRAQVVRMRSRTIYTNAVPLVPLRGTAEPIRAWARESQMDAIAHRLGMEPIELRLKNALNVGEVCDQRDGGSLSCDMSVGLRRLAREVGKSKERTSRIGARRNRVSAWGVACAVKPGPASSRSSVRLVLQSDGRVRVLTSAVEMGQGLREAAARMTAQELGISLDRVSVCDPDTAETPYEHATSSSRTTMYLGRAIVRAAESLRGRLRTCVIDLIGEGEDDEIGSIDNVLNWGSHRLPLREVLGEDEISADGSYTSTGTEFSSEVGFGAAEVEVDLTTGELHVREYVSVLQAGAVVNVSASHGQNLGAYMYALGHALFESMAYDGAGVLANGQLIDYRVPLAENVSGWFRSVLLEDHNGEGPMGSRGLGEGGGFCVAPAIANALHAAVGVRARALPISSEMVAAELAAQRPALHRMGEKR